MFDYCCTPKFALLSRFLSGLGFAFIMTLTCIHTIGSMVTGWSWFPKIFRGAEKCGVFHQSGMFETTRFNNESYPFISMGFRGLMFDCWNEWSVLDGATEVWISWMSLPPDSGDQFIAHKIQGILWKTRSFLLDFGWLRILLHYWIWFDLETRW